VSCARPWHRHQANASITSDTQYFVVHFPEPLAPSSQVTLGISYSLLSSLIPRPATISQAERQFLTYSLSAYALSAYPTVTQKTKVKFPTTNVPDYTTTSRIKTGSGSDPERQGATYTYGPYDNVAPGSTYPITVRYEFTKPVTTAHLMERDLEVSHWGGNLATEERYWLRNNGSQLRDQFSRVQWTLTNFQGLPSSALRELKYPLKSGSADPYFIDDVGNVSTSHFRPSTSPKRDAQLELRPRYPVFGGWNYSFRIGWNNNLAPFLRKAGVDSYVMKVPFVEGPKVPEGVQYDKVVVRVILPEGAKNVRFEPVEGSSSNGLPGREQIQSELSTLRSYMDTLGRTVLTLTVENLADEARDSQLVVSLGLVCSRPLLICLQIAYDYSLLDALRKPFTITAGLLSVFVATWAIGNVDVSIKKRT
jgi:oligosaccharyltransferase complex subunit alpha (ribophorin I)